MTLKTWMLSLARRTPGLKKCLSPVVPENRTIYINNCYPVNNENITFPQKFPDNCVISSKYTAWNFIFINLFNQLKRIANFYFLIVAVIQFTIPFSPVSPLTSAIPLVFVLATTAIKQGYEDWLRHKADKIVNERLCKKLNQGQIVDTQAQHIQVGDIIRVNDNNPIPCDLVLLSTSDPEGHCTIQTANLDGETNLKTFFSPPETKEYNVPEKLSDLRGVIVCQQPIADLYRFLGNITVDQSEGETATRALQAHNVLLRGAKLKNTDYIYGCAVYTGQDTKMALNSKSSYFKMSTVEKGLNRFLVVFLLILFVQCVVSTALRYWFLGTWLVDGRSRPQWYIPVEYDYIDFNEGNPVKALAVVLDFFNFYVIYNYIIPISLYVTIEFQKFFGSMFFGLDLDMYDEQIDERAKANTSDLNEELGQVEYLFCDKTGTLTENDMQFKQCSISGVLYEEREGQFTKKINDSHPVDEIDSPESDTWPFFEVLSLCHTVRIEVKTDLMSVDSGFDEIDGRQYEYHASSPDEKALVDACRQFGVVYHGYRDGQLEIKHNGRRRLYKLHQVLEFDSTRKCMSVIVENEQGKYMVLCKGAESAVLKKCKSGPKNITIEHVDHYASLGLRTLVIAVRELSTEQFHEYHKLIETAQQDLEDRDGALMRAYEVIECDMKVLGATAVEDKLQDGVKETIEKLREAGIKVWVLTGDKLETAVNVSHSAGHFDKSMHMLGFTLQSTEAEAYENLLTLEDNIRAKPRGIKVALVVDGSSLALIMTRYAEAFRDVCMLCKTVLCCRMTPIQKAEIVRMIKNSPEKPTTAAIGDGANDVSMIQEAHVGLGIMGKEGRQAMRCSDYAFGKFRFLLRALLVHGHYFYVRLSILVQYFFYKNIAFITAQFYYIFFSAYSAAPVFDTIFLLFYNITFTSLPIFLYGLFEQHIPQQMLLDNPDLYQTIRRNKNMNIPHFVAWTALGFYHSVIFSFGVYCMFVNHGNMAGNGDDGGLFVFGTTIITVCMVTVNIKLMIQSYYWCFAIYLGYAITFIGNWAMIAVYTSFVWPTLFTTETSMLGILRVLFSSGIFWLTCLLLIVAALLPDIAIKAWNDMTSPVYVSISEQKKTKTATTSRQVRYVTSNEKICFSHGKVRPTVREEPSNNVTGISLRRLDYDNPALALDEC